VLGMFICLAKEEQKAEGFVYKDTDDSYLRFFQNGIEVIGKVRIWNDGDLHVALLMSKHQQATIQYFGSKFPSSHVTL